MHKSSTMGPGDVGQGQREARGRLWPYAAHGAARATKLWNRVTRACQTFVAWVVSVYASWFGRRPAPAVLADGTGAAALWSALPGDGAALWMPSASEHAAPGRAAPRIEPRPGPLGLPALAAKAAVARTRRASVSDVLSPCSPQVRAALEVPPLDAALVVKLRARLAEARAEVDTYRPQLSKLFLQVAGSKIEQARADKRQAALRAQVANLEAEAQQLQSAWREEAELHRQTERAQSKVRARLTSDLKQTQIRLAEVEAELEDANLRALDAQSRAESGKGRVPRASRPSATTELADRLAQLSLSSPPRGGRAAVSASSAAETADLQGTGTADAPAKRFARPKAPGRRPSRRGPGANKSAC